MTGYNHQGKQKHDGRHLKSGVAFDLETATNITTGAMRYETARSFTPFDVSKDGEHCDVRSESLVSEKRFIEVKGCPQSGAVVINGPEVQVVP
jgi:hypothetical protein